METRPYFLAPTLLERVMNKTVGVLARIGLGPAYLHLLEVKGRKTGKIYSTPVNLMKFTGHHYLVGGRGHSNWSKNAASAGVVRLVRGRSVRQYRIVPVTGPRKLEVLKAYLDEYPKTVQKFFAVPAGSPPDAFRATADRHPVFEVVSQ